MEIAEAKMSQLAEREQEHKDQIQKEISEQKLTIYTQLEKTTAHLKKMRRVNN